MKILIAGFKGKNNSSKILLDNLCSKHKLYLENDKIKSCRQILKAIQETDYDKIILFGQKPLIKEKICIELIAKDKEKTLNTNYDYQKLAEKFKINKIVFKLSKNAGNSYCNHIYFFTLNYIQNFSKNTQCIFLHLPFLKNFDNMEIVLNLFNNF